jgi:hypothetical protein
MLDDVRQDSIDFLEKKEWSSYKSVIVAHGKFSEMSHGKNSSCDAKVCEKPIQDALTDVEPEHRYAFGKNPPFFVRFLSSNAFIWWWKQIGV